MKIKIDVETLIDAMDWWIFQEEVCDCQQNVRTVAEHFGLNQSTLWYAIRMNAKLVAPTKYDLIDQYISRNRSGAITKIDYKPKKFAENYVRTLNNQPVLKSTRTSKKSVLKTETEIVQNENSELPVQEHKCACKASIYEKKDKILQMQHSLNVAGVVLDNMSQSMVKQAAKIFISQKNQKILFNRIHDLNNVKKIIDEAYDLLMEISEIKE